MARPPMIWTERVCATCGELKQRGQYPQAGGIRCRRCENRRRRKNKDTGEGRPGTGSHTPGCRCGFCAALRRRSPQEDLTVWAEQRLFPGVPYEKMTSAQRMLCNDLARLECTNRRLPGFRDGKKTQERAA